jgi:hypothetical protein
MQGIHRNRLCDWIVNIELAECFITVDHDKSMALIHKTLRIGANILYPQISFIKSNNKRSSSENGGWLSAGCFLKPAAT